MAHPTAARSQASDTAPLPTVDPLPAWYASHGRHHLPWRQTRDPWAVLVSEVMLQQTSVARVLGRWERFIARWPTPGACAAASLEAVLREWDGLGYPRRAAGLWQSARAIAAQGWPVDEAGLRTLPGIGAYTARALLCLAFDSGNLPPRDVNLGRVAARCWIGAETAPAKALDAELAAHRPTGLGWRDYTLALFDVGATICRAGGVSCSTCPLAPECRSRERLRAGVPRRLRRRPAYAGSHRQLRGAVLRAMLGEPGLSLDQLRKRVGAVPAAAETGAVEMALLGLRGDGLLPEALGPADLLAT